MTVNVAQETGLIECLQCGEEMGHEDAFRGPDDEHYCEDCYYDTFTSCERCENVVYHEDIMTVEDEAWCEHCVDRHAVECDHCNDLVRAEYAHGDYNITICAACYERYYTTCVECVSIVHIDDARFVNGDSYCSDCAPEDEVIYDWDEGPSLMFHRFHDQSNVFYGVELEVERCSSTVERRDMALAIYEMAGQYVYCKRDGSLECGIEIVSHPADYDFHMQKMPWGNILKRLAEEGYRSHDAGTCGLHIHVSREAFGPDHETQLDRIHRLLYIVEKFWPYWLKLSRRTETSMRQWAARYLGEDEQLDHVPKEALLDRALYGSKYHAVNLQKPKTVEIRMFRGTLKLNTLRATLQLVNYLVGLATNDDIDLENLTWEELADNLRNLTPELNQYMKERGL